MAPRQRSIALAWNAWFLVSITLCGCSRIRLPAIDPSGERIFLPSPASTTWIGPEPHGGWNAAPWLPKPAFSGPADPPPCSEVPGLPRTTAIDPRTGLSGGPLPPGQAGELVITPRRLVAPVGGEVVVLAGLCGPDGYLVKKQPIEWILAPDGAGHFVAVGDDPQSIFDHLGRPQSRKHTAGFATSRTSSCPETVTRGTPNPTDDIHLKTGQCWISVTSSTPGTSHLTVLAPKANGWPQRRKVTTIHWVDTNWVLPAPANVPAAAAAQHRLETRVTRVGGTRPAPGWSVRYQIVSGPPVRFSDSGGQSVNITTDAQGMAPVEVINPTGAVGVSRIRIQIVRPADAANGSPEMALGDGWTTISWNAPSLRLTATGPDLVSVNAVAIYHLEISNLGDRVARNVEVSTRLPETLEFLNSRPDARQFTSQYRWQLGNLAPGARTSLSITCRAGAPSNLRLAFAVRADQIAEQRSAVATRVIETALAVRIVNPPETAEVGQKLVYEIEVTNRGSTALSRVVLRDTFDFGLRHAEGQVSPIERTIGDLAAGETRSDLAVAFIVEKSGRLCHQVTVTAAEGQTAQTPRTCVTATQPLQPTVPTLELTTNWSPASVNTQQPSTLTLRVTNTGDRLARDLQLAVDFPVTLDPQQATDGFVLPQNRNLMHWDIPGTLLPGQSVERQVVFGALEKGQLQVEVIVRQNNQVLNRRRAILRVQAANVEESRGAASDTPAPAGGPVFLAPSQGGKLTLTMRANSGTMRVGQQSTFFLELTNRRSTAEDEVVLEVVIPDGMQYTQFTRPRSELTFSSDGRSFKLQPIRTVRANDQPLKFRLTLTATKSGQFELVANVTSRQTRQPEAARAAITVQP
ncbi:MAG: hypothetical protein CMJ59_08180 [Planctomycetaceae bacterium]|nr:hypothetical protein [Planctomycetaceae bacterium]